MRLDGEGRRKHLNKVALAVLELSIQAVGRVAAEVLSREEQVS